MLSVPGELCWCVGLLSQAGCGGEVAVCMAGVMVLPALKPSKAVLGSSLTKIHKNRAMDTMLLHVPWLAPLCLGGFQAAECCVLLELL